MKISQIKNFDYINARYLKTEHKIGATIRYHVNVAVYKNLSDGHLFELSEEYGHYRESKDDVSDFGPWTALEPELEEPNLGNSAAVDGDLGES